MSTLAQDLLFVMPGVQCSGRANYRQRLIFQLLWQNTLLYRRLWARPYQWPTWCVKWMSFFVLYFPTPKFVLKVWQDNQSWIVMTNNPKFTSQTKHIAIKYHHFWKHVKTLSNLDGFIEVEYCKTEEQVIDIFYKACLQQYLSNTAEVVTELVARYQVMRECENCEGCDLAT